MWHLPLLGVGILLAWKKAKGQSAKGALSPQVNYLYNSILSHKQITPEQLREHAKNFKDAGLKYQAEILTRRAIHKETSTTESLAAERHLIAETMKSKSPSTIRKVAAMFEKIGSVGVTSDLLHHADAVERKARIKEIAPTEPAPPMPEMKAQAVTNGIHAEAVGPDEIPAKTPPPAAPVQTN